METIYIETTIVGHLTGSLMSDPIATNGVRYLLTWNFKHIANASLRAKIEMVCRDSGFEPPIICTPEELLGNSNDT